MNYRGYSLLLEEHAGRFRASALLDEEQPWPDGHHEFVVSVKGEDADEVLLRLCELIDEELGPPEVGSTV